jgi:hypothetical protein
VSIAPPPAAEPGPVAIEIGRTRVPVEIGRKPGSGGQS